MRFVVSPSTSSNFAPAVEKGRAAVLLCFFTVSHLVSSGNRQAPRLCGGLRLGSISKRGAGGFSIQCSAFSSQPKSSSWFVILSGVRSPDAAGDRAVSKDPYSADKLRFRNRDPSTRA